MESPGLNRMFTLAGHFHSGKTSLIDMIVEREIIDHDDEDEDNERDGSEGFFGGKEALPAGEGGGTRWCDTLIQEQGKCLILYYFLSVVESRGE